MTLNIRIKYCIILALFLTGFFYAKVSYGQARLDSLVAIWESKSYKASNKKTILKELARDSQNPQQKLKFSQLWQENLTDSDSLVFMYDAVMQEGNAYRQLGDLSDALTSFLKASKIAQDMDSTRLVALSDVTLGDVYSVMGNHENSINYYNQGIQQLRDLNRESIDLASALLNAGDEYFNAEKYDSAMNLFYESSMLFKKLNFEIGSAYNMGNIGMVYAKQGKTQLAEANINEAILILEEFQDYSAISVYLQYAADIYLEQKDLDQALKYAQRSLDLATKYQLKDEISKANEELSLIYEELGNSDLSLFHFKEFVRYKDSINNVATVQEIADQITEYEVSQKQIELDLINQQKENQNMISKAIGAVLILVSILTYLLFRRNRVITKTRKVLEEERRKSNKLLKNILPEETAEELRENGVVQAKKYKNVTVLFSDFNGFTKYAEELPPEELVRTVDLYFSEFDRIMDRFNIEKIKTIGDSYMCASGLPVPDNNHAENMILAAKAMLTHVERLKEVHAVDEARFDIRIGIHSGPVVAGVVGERKFAYDIWGDTVNVASRMESACELGRINVSATTYALTKGKFDFKNRGAIEVKNRGAVEMYYLDSTTIHHE